MFVSGPLDWPGSGEVLLPTSPDHGAGSGLRSATVGGWRSRLGGRSCPRSPEGRAGSCCKERAESHGRCTLWKFPAFSESLWLPVIDAIALLALLHLLVKVVVRKVPEGGPLCGRLPLQPIYSSIERAVGKVEVDRSLREEVEEWSILEKCNFFGEICSIWCESWCQS